MLLRSPEKRNVSGTSHALPVLPKITSPLNGSNVASSWRESVAALL
jgi:hypothetical protein